MIDDLKLKDSKSGVFSDFERNTVGSTFCFCIKIGLFPVLLSAVGVSNFSLTNIWLTDLQDNLSSSNFSFVIII